MPGSPWPILQRECATYLTREDYCLTTTFSMASLSINSQRLSEAIHSTCDAYGAAMRYGP